MSDLASRLRTFRDLRPEGPEAADRIEALEARVTDLEALRTALVRDNRDKTNAVREALARVAELEGELADLLGATSRTPGINYWRQKAQDVLAAAKGDEHE